MIRFIYYRANFFDMRYLKNFKKERVFMRKFDPILKNDTTKNWEKAVNYIPKLNEIIIYEDMDPVGIKIGNGVNKLSELKFANGSKASVEGDVLDLK